MNGYGKKRSKIGLSFNRMEIGSLSTVGPDALKAWQLVTDRVPAFCQK
jgi:hypothetical protein